MLDWWHAPEWVSSSSWAPAFCLTVIKIAFADGASTVVNVEMSLADESKRQRWEAFVTAARQAAA
jgi:hypothetical protein